MRVEVVEVAPKKPDAPFVIGGVYEDGAGDYFLLTKMPDDSGYVWVNLTANESSSVVGDSAARHIANDIDFIPGAVLHIPKEVG